MIVDKQIESLIVTASQWPGSLWRARIVKQGDMSGLIANPSYWRACEIEIIEELPIGMLFGPYGEGIPPLLSQITTLTLSEVDKLHVNMAENSDAEAAWVRAWNFWNENLEYPRQHKYDCDEGMTLASPGNHDHEMSPVNRGFSLISDLIWQRARKVEGQNAFIEFIEFGEVELKLSPRWNAACKAFLQAAMALGMSQYFSNMETIALTRAWSSVFQPK